ncbi:MAG: hypothetical protein ABI573_07575 [Chloroflexota bacterium]
MIASEFAFLALGLVLGAASGAALVIVLRSRPPAPEVRVTVSHDAVPRRSATLSSDAFTVSATEPARGGPADRRRIDRPDGSSAESESGESRVRSAVAAASRPGLMGRTSVPFGPSVTARAVVSIEPERDAALDALRTPGARAAARMFGHDMPGPSSIPTGSGATAPQISGGSVAIATQPMTERPVAAAPAPAAITITPFVSASTPGVAAASALAPVTAAGPTLAPVTAPAPVIAPAPVATAASDPELDLIDQTPALTRILRGDHHALYAVAEALGSDDPEGRRAWEVAIRSVADAIVARTIAVGWLDFPRGNPFWDSFTVVQCRDIAGALAADGHRFDGIDGWADDRVPTYRDLTIAVAGAGLEPRRIRAWPTQEEIDDLYLEVTAAPDAFVAMEAPNLDLEELHELVGFGDTDRALVWANWDRVRAVLTSPIPSV